MATSKKNSSYYTDKNHKASRKMTYSRKTMNYSTFANNDLVNSAITDYIQVSIDYEKNGFEDLLSRYSNLGYLLKNCFIIAIFVGLQNLRRFTMILLTIIQLIH